MQENIIPVFTCDFCKKKQFRKCDMSRHEKFCSKNPANQHKCFEFCTHLVKTEVGYEGTDRYGVEYTGKKTEFSCAILSKKMFSYIAEKRKLPVLNEEVISRMPLECDKYETKYSFNLRQEYKDEWSDF